MTHFIHLLVSVSRPQSFSPAKRKLFLVTEFNYLWLYLELHGFTEARLLFAHYDAKSKSLCHLFVCVYGTEQATTSQTAQEWT